MPKAWPIEVRNIFLRQYQMGFDAQTISQLNDIPLRTIQSWIQRYDTFGSVKTLSERFGDDRGRPRIITDDDLLLMIKLWSDDPTAYVDEIALDMTCILGRWIDAEALRCWKKKLGITRKKLWKVCLLRRFP